MVVSLLTHERIKTTLPKAKELRSWADKIITLGKKGDLPARRRVFDLLRDRGIVKKLFEEIAPRFKDREGGYTRIFKMGWRAGDAAPLSLIELTTEAAEKEKKKSTVKKAREALKKVAPKRKAKGEKAKKGEKKEGKKEAPKAKAKKKPSEEKSE